jgi:outer membrane biosynthesis protein TonB
MSLSKRQRMGPGAYTEMQCGSIAQVFVILSSSVTFNRKMELSRAVVAHAFNPSTWEAEAGRFLSLRPVYRGSSRMKRKEKKGKERKGKERKGKEKKRREEKRKEKKGKEKKRKEKKEKKRKERKEKKRKEKKRKEKKRKEKKRKEKKRKEDGAQLGGR